MYLLWLLTLIPSITGSNEEQFLRNHLFNNTNYDNKIRPVLNSSAPIFINMGLAVQNLEEFNQMEENIKLNIWLRSNWDDEYLSWNSNVSNLTFLPVSDEIWLHDVELMNAAGKPELYLLNGGENLYPSGNILWSKPAIFKFSCSLELEFFPFDKQTCSMKFGSWLYSNRFLKLRPYESVESQIDILDSFSHSEWQYETSDLIVSNETRPCCPGEYFDVITYNFKFKRYTHYYTLSMGMTVSLVLTSFIIMLMEPDNVSRTGTAVFIPLTILALQLTIADKIPVVGYATLMDNFFICCFVSSMIVSIESGIMFALITTSSQNIYKILDKLYDVDKLKQKDKERKQLELKKLNKNDSSSNVVNQQDRQAQEEFEGTIRVVESSLMNGDVPVQESDTDRAESTQTNVSALSIDVVKTIDYNDKLLRLTYEQKIIFDELKRQIRIVDNVFRIILPMTFFIYIGYIYSHE